MAHVRHLARREGGGKSSSSHAGPGGSGMGSKGMRSVLFIVAIFALSVLGLLMIMNKLPSTDPLRHVGDSALIMNHQAAVLSDTENNPAQHSFTITNTRQQRKDLLQDAHQVVERSEGKSDKAVLSEHFDEEKLVADLQALPEQPDTESEQESSHDVQDGQASEGLSLETGNRDVDKSKEAASSVKTKGVNSLGLDTILLIICSNRPEYLEKTLKYVLQYHPRESVPIVISQDGNNPTVRDVINKAKEQFSSISSLPFSHIQHIPSNNMRYENGYFKLADHFKFALDKVFSSEFNAQRVIILEEDLQIAPDFFEFFAATAPLLEEDNQLLAISAWNDNGFESAVRDNKMIFRSDFFPGLGWMMTKTPWDELGPKWPRAYWDDWLREPKQRQGRHILRPEVPRTLHFGIHGVSNAQYSDFLQAIKLNTEMIPFTQMDLSHLSSESKWDEYYLSQVRRAKPMSLNEAKSMLMRNSGGNPDIRLTYDSLDENSRAPDSYATLASWTGAMNNVKAGVPRTAYKGIVTIYKGPLRIHLVPKTFK